jgi:ribosomal protein S18 acetylase RimI-like enzyme
VILLYTGLTTPTILAFGLDDCFAGFLAEVLQITPREFHAHFHTKYRPVFLEAGYRETPYGTAWKMHLRDKPDGPLGSDDHIVRLDTSHEGQLLTLYRKGYPDNYFDRRMLQSGKYLGYIDSGRIVAVTGVHVDSDKYRIACLGNIVTDPEYRGRGLAAILTARLVRELLGEGKTVCLNVMADNLPAIRCYEKLGFVKVHEYQEALFHMP